MKEQDAYKIAGQILDNSIKIEPHIGQQIADRIVQTLLAIQQEPRVMPKIAEIIQQAAKDWKVKIITQNKDEETKICESIANDQIQQFALYVEQKITESNFAA